MLEANNVTSRKRHCLEEGNKAFSEKSNNLMSPQPKSHKKSTIFPSLSPPCSPSTPKQLRSGVSIDQPSTVSPQLSLTSSCSFDLALVDELEEQALLERNSVVGFDKNSPRLGHNIAPISSPYNLKRFDRALVDYLEESARKENALPPSTFEDMPINDGVLLKETNIKAAPPDGKSSENTEMESSSIRNRGRPPFLRCQVREAFHRQGEEGRETKLVVVAEDELLSQQSWMPPNGQNGGEGRVRSATPLPSSHPARYILDEAEKDCESTSPLTAQSPRLVILRHNWSQACVSPGDIIHVVFLDRGNVPSDYRLSLSVDPIIIDRERNLLVHHPDVFVAPTQVSEAVHCDRMAILRASVGRGMGRSNKSCAIGSMKHQLFERALLEVAGNSKGGGLLSCTPHSEWSKEIQGWCADIIRVNVKDLYATGIKDQEAQEELFGIIPFLCDWIRDFVCLTNVTPSTKTDGGVAVCSRGKGRNALVRIDSVLATEEEIWSTIYGLRGCLDVTARVALLIRGGWNDDEHVLSEALTVPVEFKTGKRSDYVVYDHRAQVVLYSLMTLDRYSGDPHYATPSMPSMYGDGISGLLVYMESTGVYTEVVTPNRHELVALMQARNKHAADVHRSRTIVPFALPRPINQRNQCERCFQAPECMLYQRAERLNEGLTFEALHKETGHLSEAQVNVFSQWDLGVDHEASVCKGRGKFSWHVPSWERELQTGLCMSGMAWVQQNIVEADDDSAYFSLRNRRKHYIHTFARRQDSKNCSRLGKSDGLIPSKTFLTELSLEVGDCIVVGLESDTVNGEIGQHVHLIRGKIVRLTRDEVDLICDGELQVPGYSSGTEDVIGDLDGTYLPPLCGASFRLDKDDTTAGMNKMKANLVRLFVVGPEQHLTGSEMEDRTKIGDQYTQKRQQMRGYEHMTEDGVCRLRSLVVDLAKPRFAIDVQGVSEIFPCTSVGQELAQRFTTELNQDQQVSIRRAVWAEDYTLLLGMPGTGKTATICFLCELMVARGKCILVTSYTHTAVDNLLLRLIERGVDCLRVTAANSIGSVHPGVMGRCLLERVVEGKDATNPCSMPSSLNVTEEYRMTAMSSPVVGVTCLGAAQHPLFQQRTFDLCIVDEAGQITIPAILPALRCAQVFCLVGDFKQLAPLVISKSAKEAGLDISLIQRLSESHPEAQVELRMHYRMNKDITYLCNAITYGGHLTCGNSVVAGRRLRLTAPSEPCEYPHWLKCALEEERSVVFLDTDSYGMEGREEKAGGQSKGVVSRCEAAIVRLFILALEKSGVGGKEIGIISPYRSQVALILASVSGTISGEQKKWLSDVEIKTIDKYQGRDKKVIVLSLVRSNDSGNVGNLLRDWRRVNVALSRAQAKLILVGSFNTLSSADVGSAPQKLSRVISEKGWVVETTSHRTRD